MMTTPASAIKDEVRVLIDVQIETFGQPAPLTSSELEDCRRRAERIKLLGPTVSHRLRRIHRVHTNEKRVPKSFRTMSTLAVVRFRPIERSLPESLSGLS
jgi:hypothetical protein